MNDDTNVYVALVVPDVTPQTDSTDFAWFRFDNANNRTLDVNDDLLAVGVTAFVDAYYNGAAYSLDAQQDGMTAGSYLMDGTAFIEVSHPLNSGDVNDIAIAAGDRFGLCVSYFDDNTVSRASPLGCELTGNEQDRYVVIQSVP